MNTLETSRGLANGRDTSTTVGPIIGCSDGYVPNQDRTMCVPPSTAVTNLTGKPIYTPKPGEICTSNMSCVAQIDTSGNLMVYHRPDQPDGHWAIILVLALAVVWMWATGAILVWCCMARVRWRSLTSVKMPTEFLKGQWRWRYLFWPLYVTGLKP